MASWYASLLAHSANELVLLDYLSSDNRSDSALPHSGVVGRDRILDLIHKDVAKK